MKVKAKEKAKDERSFKCYCCKRTLVFEPRLQCILCEHVEICKLCFKGKYHEQHEFIMRPQPDKDWEPFFRDNPANYNEEYQRIMRELQTREIRPEDYDLLLQLESSQNAVPLPKFLALAYEKVALQDKGPQYNSLVQPAACAFCDLRIEDREKGLMLRGCDHCLHKNCLEDMFRVKKTKCPKC